MDFTYDAQRNEYCAYVAAEPEIPFGATLGNYKTFASCTPKGNVRGLWDADTDQIIFGSHQIAYRVEGEPTLFPRQMTREFTFLPYAQVAQLRVGERVQVTETFYVPHGQEHGRRVAFVVDVVVHNRSDSPLRVAVFPWALLVGQRFYGEPEPEVRAQTDGRRIRAVNEVTGAARIWGADRDPHECMLALREQVLLSSMERGALLDGALLDVVTPSLAEFVSRRIFGAFEYRMEVAPREREELRLAVCFHRDGTAVAEAGFEAILADRNVQQKTAAFYAERLAQARFMVPSPEIARGVVWAKTNMLRVAKEYPQGWGSTNSPPSDILVSRDTSWFVHGYDYLWPQFSRDALEVFNRCLEPSGQVVEYVRGVSGYKTSYDLNINDDTPLHLVATLHHYNCTLDDDWLREVYPLCRKIAEYMLSQRDQNGLLFCHARGVELFGISSWRNIIPQYNLDGAVTEINAEAYFALEAVAKMAAVLEIGEDWRYFGDAATALREKMMAHLFNVDTGGFVLNYDQAQNYQDNFTADEVFPVLFEVADAQRRRAILRRLQEDDFTTPVGLRTISIADSWYFPSHGFGLLGGIWPDLTLWFAVALARNGMVRECAEWLRRVYATMEMGNRSNVVPGQFAEWFDGGSLTNRGMYLSPWTGAKYLWAVAETLCGLDGYRTSGRLHIAPLVPPEWAWVAAGRVHHGGRLCSYVVDLRERVVYCDTEDASAEPPLRSLYAGRDVSYDVEITPIDVGAIAFEAEGGVRIFLLNASDAPRDAAVTFRGRRYRERLEAGTMRQIVVGQPALTPTGETPQGRAPSSKKRPPDTCPN